MESLKKLQLDGYLLDEDSYILTNGGKKVLETLFNDDANILKIHNNMSIKYNFNISDLHIIISKNFIDEHGLILNEEIGCGNNGIVYSGNYNNKEVAVKLRIKYCYEKESEIATKIGELGLGPKIYTSFDYKDYDKDVIIEFIVMEKLKYTLKEFFITNPNVKELAIKCNKLLTRFEENGFYHFDMKINNIMVDDNNNLFIIDHGTTYNAEFLGKYYPEEYLGWTYIQPPKIDPYWDKLCLLIDAYHYSEIPTIKEFTDYLRDFGLEKRYDFKLSKPEFHDEVNFYKINVSWSTDKIFFPELFEKRDEIVEEWSYNCSTKIF